MARPCRPLHRARPHRARRHDRRCRAARHHRRPASRPHRRAMGEQPLRRAARRLASLYWKPRGPVGAQAALPRRPHRVRRRQSARRRRVHRGGADRGACGAGSRGGVHHALHPLHRERRVSRQIPCRGVRGMGRRDLRRCRRRPTRRRCAHPVGLVALDLPGEPPTWRPRVHRRALHRARDARREEASRYRCRRRAAQRHRIRGARVRRRRRPRPWLVDPEERPHRLRMGMAERCSDLRRARRVRRCRDRAGPVRDLGTTPREGAARRAPRPRPVLVLHVLVGEPHRRDGRRRSFAIIFVLPLYLINALGLDVMGAGLVLAAMAVGAFLSGAAARHLAARFGAPGTVLIGLGLEVAGVLILALLLGPATPGWLIAIPLVVYGLGLGLASAQLTGTVLRDIPVEVSGQGSATQSTVRQIGSALGTAFAGATLSISLALTLPTALGDAGLTGAEADSLADATRQSAGTTIMQLREQGSSSSLGDQTATAVDALTSGFADATRWALLIATVFLALGFIGALRLRRASVATPINPSAQQEAHPS
ncbi:membrane protein of unknown function [Micropruina glycogenica]|uniref:Major facilitator superfamily (MFS) profile domain-containing protein n=1 Tax=Micropruina glycogenica TaxID=75385 RepID=A0A2N9JMQ0_9ACTN|nr:membrane protein of unknown function [Micropruina glycogenica]